MPLEIPGVAVLAGAYRTSMEAAHRASEESRIVALPEVVVLQSPLKRSHLLQLFISRPLSGILRIQLAPLLSPVMPGQFPLTSRPQKHASNLDLHNTVENDRVSSESADTIKSEGSNLDLTQRLERKLAEYNASANVFKRWLLELTSWTTSALCMGAVIAIYLHINGCNMVASGTFLNTANVLGKVASAALIVPTSEALGQLKWNWFLDSKAMWDFEIFDKASRGPWGAALLLYRTKGRSLAALGALLIVLLLATDTFFQQVVTFPDRWAPVVQASEIPRMIEYRPTYDAEYFAGIELNYVDQNIRPIARQYFLDNGTQPTPFGNGTRADVPLSCPANNCTWSPYETLGVCSQCVETSELLEYACLNTTIDWSANYVGTIDENRYPVGTVCGYFLNVTSSKPVLMTGYVANDSEGDSGIGEVLLSRTLPLTEMISKMPLSGGSINFRHLRHPILDVLITSVANVSADIRSEVTPVMHECVLAWCVKTMRSAYDMGRYHEEVVSTYINSTIGPWPWESYDLTVGGENVTMTIYAEEIVITPPSYLRDRLDGLIFNTTYRMSNLTASNAIMVFDDFIPSTYTAKSPSEKPILRYKNFSGGPTTRNISFNPLLASNNITRHWERLATSMTDAIRTDPSSRQMVLGMAYNKSQYVSVQWEWLVFPFALLLLSLTFLVSTMAKTSKESATGIWKTSALPGLIYSLPEEARGKIVTSSTWYSSHEVTKKTRIKLLPDHGWRLSGQASLKSPRTVVRKNQPPPGWI